MALNFEFVTGVAIRKQYDLEIYTNWDNEFICIERTEEKDDAGKAISISHIVYDIIPVLDFIINWYISKVAAEEKNILITSCIAKMQPAVVLKLLMDLKTYAADGYAYKIDNDYYGNTYIEIYNASNSKKYRIVFDFDEENEVYMIYSINRTKNDKSFNNDSRLYLHERNYCYNTKKENRRPIGSTVTFLS